MKQHIVIGAVAVAKTESGSERYLYRGAILGEGFTEGSIKHLLALGLIGELVTSGPPPVVESEFDSAVKAEVERIVNDEIGPAFEQRVQEAAERLLLERASSESHPPPVQQTETTKVVASSKTTAK